MRLTNVLKTLGYDNESIHAMTEAAKATEIAKASASPTGMTALTPMQAASVSQRNRQVLEQTRGVIRHLSACKIRDRGSIQDRVAVKSNLAALGLLA
jgi:hypothetical protein